MEETKGLVSVTIPFFNAERFLRETIESVLAQRYATWELLLVDDGSSDGSSTIAQSYAALHPDKIFYLEHAGHRNLGLPAARNLGARSAGAPDAGATSLSLIFAGLASAAAS